METQVKDPFCSSWNSLGQRAQSGYCRQTGFTINTHVIQASAGTLFGIGKCLVLKPLPGQSFFVQPEPIVLKRAAAMRFFNLIVLAEDAIRDWESPMGNPANRRPRGIWSHLQSIFGRVEVVIKFKVAEETPYVELSFQTPWGWSYTAMYSKRSLEGMLAELSRLCKYNNWNTQHRR